ncbi:MAG TPA: hypothetical protein VFR86_09010 [Burkholderiaceae bacterium]|nr:hypothetical protein [Burkholderiaceae bacterium]
MIVALALMPISVLFIGMSVSDNFPSFADWDVIGVIVLGLGVAVVLALRALDRDETEPRQTK